jgi:phosphate transport system substrate-binding protein
MNVERKGISTVVVVLAIVVVAVVLGAGLVMYTRTGSGGSTSASISTSGTISLDFTTPLSLKAGGSSFVNPLMQTWVYALTSATSGRVTIDYEPVGSGAGVDEFFSGLLDYAGSDAPLTYAQLAANASTRTVLEIPEALGGVAIFYNIPGVTASLNLTGSALEQIYLGKITMWNDPAIASSNPGVTLPAQPIVPVHRSDGSGTTYALTTYFSRIDPSWATQVGVGVAVNWPSTELAAKGSGGVAGLVTGTPYSIGYADTYYAYANGLTKAAIQNSAGIFLQPTLASITSAATAFSDQLQKNVTYSITDAPGAGSYPISTFTYLIVWANQPTAEKADCLSNFFWYMVHDGQVSGPKLFFPTLPSQMVTIDEGLIRQINYNGQAYVP